MPFSCLSASFAWAKSLLPPHPPSWFNLLPISLTTSPILSCLHSVSGCPSIFHHPARLETFFNDGEWVQLMPTVKVHKARQGGTWWLQPGAAAGGSSGRQGHEAWSSVVILISYVRHIRVTMGLVSRCCIPMGVGGRPGRSGSQVGNLIVVGQNVGAAAASSFASLLCSVGSLNPHWLERAEAKWSLCWFWALNRSLCLFFFFGSLGRCFPGPPG